MLRRIHIVNFKSLVDVSVDLGPFTVLIGCNGAGKSAFLQSLSVLSWLIRYKSVNERFEQEGVTFNDLVSLKASTSQMSWVCTVDNLGTGCSSRMVYCVVLRKRHHVYVEVEFASPACHPTPDKAQKAGLPSLERVSRHFAEAQEGSESLKIEGAVIAHSLLQEVREQTLFGEAKFPVLGALAGELAGFRHFQIWGPDSLRGESAGPPTGGLSEKGQNLPSVIAYLKARRAKSDAYDRLLGDMRRAYPSLDDIEVRHFPAGRFGLTFLEKPEVGKKRRLKYSPTQMSDGFLRLLALTALRYQRGKVSILGYEEPENGLHPQLLEQCVSQLRKIAESGTQVIVTTHSPYLLDYLMDTPEGQLKADLKVVVRGKDGATKILPVSEKKLAEARAQGIRAGELWSLLVDERELT